MTPHPKSESKRRCAPKESKFFLGVQVRAASAVAAQWLLQSNSPAAQQVVDELVKSAGMEGLLALASTASTQGEGQTVKMEDITVTASA